MFYPSLSGFSALHRAASRGDDEEVAKLLEEASLDTFTRDTTR